METIEAIWRRKSTRTFSKEQIDIAVLKDILMAGIQAPSPKNVQPWRFLLVDKEEDRMKIADILEDRLKIIKDENEFRGVHRPDILSAFESARVIREAPVLIFVYLDHEKCKGYDDNVNWELNAKDFECTHIMAVGAAIQNILLAATAKGIDSLWIGDVFYAYDGLCKYLGSKGSMMSAIALGYSTMDTREKSRKNYENVVTRLS